MTVVHLVPAMEQGGVETVVCDLNRALVRAGWRSVVVSNGGRLVAQVREDGGEHVSLDLKSKNPLTAPVRAWKLKKTLRALAADGETPLVCAHSRIPAWLFVLARQLNKTSHSIIRPFDHSIISSSHSIIRPFGHSIISSFPFLTYAHGANSVSRYSAVMTRGDRVITPSRFLADYLMRNYPDATDLKARVRIIHPAVDLTRFDPAALDADIVARLRRDWGIQPGDRVVMAVGRITPLKGFDHLIRDLAGRDKTGLLAELKALAASLGVADRVVFAGAQTKIPECLALADLVVSGNVTKPESFGLSVAEALAMNKPVRLLRRFGGAAEILDAVASARQPTRREAVRALCDFDIMSRKTLAVYEELVR